MQPMDPPDVPVAGGARVSNYNAWISDGSADALGNTACLYAYSNLSFAGPDAFADVCFDHYHWLREFLMGHPEVRKILVATD